MASQSFGTPSASQPSQWVASSATCNRSYMVAAMRAVPMLLENAMICAGVRFW